MSRDILTRFRPDNALLTDAEVARAVEMRRSGSSLATVARALDVSTSCVYRLFLGVTYGGRGRVTEVRRPRSWGNALGDAEIARAVEMRRAGVPVKRIRRELGVSERMLGNLFAGRTYDGKGKVERPRKLAS